MKIRIMGIVIGVALGAQAGVKLYDGFAAGGSTPGVGQYKSDPATTTGSNNDSVIGQAPVLTGFDAVDLWVSGDPFSTDVYPRINDTGLEYTDVKGAKLLTQPGGFDLSSGTATGTREVRRYTNISGALPYDGIFFSALMQFGAESDGMVRWTQGYAQPFQRDHYVGFTTNGYIYVGVDSTVFVSSNTVYSINTPHLVVVKWYEENMADVWVDPSDITNLAAMPKALSGVAVGYVGNNAAYSLDYLKIKVNAKAGSSFLVDEVRFATTWPEVLPLLIQGGPFIETAPVGEVSYYSATLNGFLASTGAAPTTVWAAWGVAGSLGASTPLANWPHSALLSPNPMTNSATPVSFAVSGLDAATTYRYTFFASNSVGVVGALGVQAFTTLNDDPVIAVDLATDVTKNSFSLNGTLSSTGNAPVTVWAVWDTDDHPAAVIPADWPNAVDLGVATTGAVSHAVSGLIDGARYTYRFYSTNANGAVWSPAKLVLLDLPPTIYDGFPGSATPNQDQYQTGGGYSTDLLVGQSPLLNGFDGATASAWSSTYIYASNVYWQVRSEGLSYTRLKTMPGSLRFFREAAGQEKRVSRDSAASVVSESWWVAFLIQYSVSNGTSFTVELNGCALSTNRCLVGINPSGHLTFVGGGALATSATLGSVLSTNETHLVLMHFTEQTNSFYAAVDIWLDPTLKGSSAALGPPDIADQSTIFSEYQDTSKPNNNIDVQYPFKRVALYSSYVYGAVNFFFDEFIVTKSYENLPLEKNGTRISVY